MNIGVRVRRAASGPAHRVHRADWSHDTRLRDMAPRHAPSPRNAMSGSAAKRRFSTSIGRIFECQQVLY